MPRNYRPRDERILTYAGGADSIALRAALPIAPSRGWQVASLDVKTASHGGANGLEDAPSEDLGAPRVGEGRRAVGGRQGA